MISILFSSPCGPYPKASLESDPYDLYYYRNTLGQKMFQLKTTQSWHPLHLLAQNLPVNSVVIENADLNVFVKTLQERTFEIVAIGYTSISVLKSFCGVG